MYCIWYACNALHAYTKEESEQIFGSCLFIKWSKVCGAMMTTRPQHRFFMNEICLENILMLNKLMEDVSDNQISYFISHKLQFFSYLDRRPWRFLCNQQVCITYIGQLARTHCVVGILDWMSWVGWIVGIFIHRFTFGYGRSIQLFILFYQQNGISGDTLHLPYNKFNSKEFLQFNRK